MVLKGFPFSNELFRASIPIRKIYLDLTVAPLNGSELQATKIVGQQGGGWHVQVLAILPALRVVLLVDERVHLLHIFALFALFKAGKGWTWPTCMII